MNVDIKGAIVSNDDKWIYEWCGYEATAPKDVLALIEAAKGEKLDVYINSGGGDIFAGSEIYAALNAYTGEVKIHVVGFAGSAASVIAMAGTSDITATAMFMCHNVSGGGRGDYHALDKASEVLKKANKAISAAYQQKTGKPETELLAMMDKETWLTAQEAVDEGFIDKIAENKNLKLSASYGGQELSQTVIDKIRATVKAPLKAEDLIPDKKQAEAKLKLLNLGGKQE